MLKTTTDAFKEYLNEKVIVFLMNGFQLKGNLTEVFEDGGVRVIDFNGFENTVMPHAISTIQK